MAFSIRIIAFGRKGNRLHDEIEHYTRLIRPYASLTVDYLKPASAKGRSVADQLSREEKLMTSRWPKTAYSVALSEQGKSFASEAFARWVERRQVSGRDMVLNIGSAHGLSASLKKGCDEVISLSRLTLSHGISLVVLVEQHYRAFTILKGHPYHKN